MKNIIIVLLHISFVFLPLYMVPYIYHVYFDGKT